MSIKEFCQKYQYQRKPIINIVKKWKSNDIENVLNHLTFIGVITADGFIGDGLSDRIPPDVLEAMQIVFKKNPIETYGDARQYIRETLEKGEGSHTSFISLIKGQIAENKFLEASEGKACLATSGNQEGWDIAVDCEDFTQYVQVKTIADPSTIIQKMKEVQAKVDAGVIVGDNAETVNQIDFAIPHDLLEKVQDLQKNHPEIIDVNVIPLGISADEAGELASESLNNLGPDALSHLFGELLSGIASTGAIFAMISAVRVINGSKKIDEAIVDVMGQLTLAGAGYGAGLATEVALDNAIDLMLTPALAGTGVGIGARIIVKKAVSSRLDFYSNIKLHNETLAQNIASLRIA